MTSKFAARPIQNGRFIEVTAAAPDVGIIPWLTRLEATELRDALTKALRKTRSQRDD